MSFHAQSLLVVVMSLGLFASGVRAQAQMASQVTQHGITWTFDREYPVGQFVNGDWWVVGPVTVVNVDPAPGMAPEDEVTELARDQWGNTGLQDDPRMRNGSMVVERSVNRQAYDSRGRNFDPDVAVSFPYELGVNRSLISSISHRTMPNRHLHHELMWASEQMTYSALRAAAVLTSLPEAPPADAFRPPYAGTHKPIFRASDLRWDLLLELEAPDDVPNWATVERYLERPWLDHMNGSWVQAIVVPTENQPGYSREHGRIISLASLMVHLDVPRQQKETLLIRLVQNGIDIRGIAEVGGNWNQGGGITNGRKWPPTFAGLMLDEPWFSDMPETAIFHEDAQTYYGQGWHGQTALWQMVIHHGHREPYEHKHPDQWERWDQVSESYRLCCNAQAWVGYGLAAQLMGAKRLWDHDAFFDYLDRWMREDDPYAEQRGGRPRPSQETVTYDPFVTQMWRMHRPAVTAQPYGERQRKWSWRDGGQWIDVSRPEQ